MNAYLSDQPVRLSPLRDEQGNQPRFGLLLESGRPGMHVGELPAQWLKGLARSHHLLLLRGFAAFADAESLTRYCSAARNSSACCAINPTRLVFQWWKRNFRIARRVPPGYPN